MNKEYFYENFDNLIKDIVKLTTSEKYYHVQIDDEPTKLLFGYSVTLPDNTIISYKIKLKDIKNNLPRWKRLTSIEERAKLAEELNSGRLPIP